MCEVLIFGGTTEGRELAEYCAEADIKAAVSVATEYGAGLLPESSRIKKLVGRLGIGEMKEIMTGMGCRIVIDATHPYAEEVTRNIAAACNETGIKRYRLLRSSEKTEGCTEVCSMEELVELLNSNDKTILSTLGSKELFPLTGVRDHTRRVWIRALPAESVRRSCTELGFSGSQLILEKGPFTVEQNVAHIKLSGAGLLVTKESGAAGGFPEKLAAAGACGIGVIVLARPHEEGCTFDDIKKILDEMR